MNARSLILLAGLLICPALFAQPAGDPVALTRQTVDDVMSDMRANSSAYEADRTALDAMVHERLLPRFNFTAMTQLAVGRPWTQASAEQKSALETEFRKLLTRSYTNVLFGNREAATNIRSNKTSAQGDAIIEMEVSRPTADPIVLAFRMRDSKGDWKVIDVSVNGVSLIVNYRTSFTREINQSGLDGLIKNLQQKNRENAG